MLKVDLIAHTPEPERVVAAAAKLCYSAVGGGRADGGPDPRRRAPNS